jgi:tRNA uridine 5-carboxymethylaminomethyl modification enzyme
LTPIGKSIGLVNDERWKSYCKRQKEKQKERQRLFQTVIPPTEELNKLLVSCETTPVVTGIRLEELLKRPQLDYNKLSSIDIHRPTLDALVQEQVEVEIKYEGYIKRQQASIDEMRRLECKSIPNNINYYDIIGLRKEAQEKLTRIKPNNIGQASRISGVSPADISVLIVWLNMQSKEETLQNEDKK